jgi:hypothetical protein
MSVWGKSPYLNRFLFFNDTDSNFVFQEKLSDRLGECLENLRGSEREREGS